MNIAGVSQGQPLIAPQKPMEDSGQADAQIRALEQKLQRLGNEKQKAAQNGDEEKARKLEKQIQELKAKIEQLRNQDKNRQEDSGKAETVTEKKAPREPGKGEYIDELA